MAKLNKNIEAILSILFKTKKKLSPSEWAESRRFMSSDVSAFPGKFSFNKTPYSREILDCLSPYNPATEIAIMKGAQIGISTGVIENGVGYIIDEEPANILFMSADKELSKQAFESKIDNMIDNSGLREKIRPNSPTSKRSGNTSGTKEFFGGRLFAGSVQNASKLRQVSYRYIFADDFEAANRDDSREGNVRDVLLQRANSFASKMKIFYISTPGIKQISSIEPVFEMGDQRKYYMPCPECGELITFEWLTKNKDGEYCGVTYDTTEEGELIEDSVRYRCPECGGEFKEGRNKTKMLKLGKWIPTAVPVHAGFRSYHISALYSPAGMFNWTHYARQWVEIQKNNDQGKLKAFLNVVLGQTYEERGKATSAIKISQNTREYNINEVPVLLSEKDGNGAIVSLLFACDLNGEQDDGRLDYEVTAVSERGVTYSVAQGSIGTFQKKRDKRRTDEGRVKWSYVRGTENCIWDELDNLLQSEYNTDTGVKMRIMLAAVDVGFFSQLAYAYIDDRDGVIGIMGDTITSNKLYSNNKRYKMMVDRNNCYVVNVNRYKDDLSDFMALDHVSGQEQPRHFMNFPTPAQGMYTNVGYFCEFEGEHKKLDLNKNGDAISSSWSKKKADSRNHFWDCRVYILALQDIYLELFCKQFGDKQAKKYPSWDDYCRVIKAVKNW